MLTNREELEALKENKRSLRAYWDTLKIKRESIKKQIIVAEQSERETELTREFVELEFDDEINEDRDLKKGNGQQWSNEPTRKTAKRRMQLESDTWKDANTAVERAEFIVKQLKTDLSTVEDDIKKMEPVFKGIVAEMYAIVALQQADTAQVDDTRVRMVLNAERRMPSVAIAPN